MARQRVGNEQLTDWPNHATTRDGAPPVLVDDLVADLLDARAEVRALRAQEGELRDAVEHQRGMYEREHNTVHELQQRITNAMAIYGNAGSIDNWLAKMVDALTGTEGTDHG